MADRYQDRLFPTQSDYSGEHDRGSYPNAPGKAESDPLAELARLIGQTDAFGAASKTPHPLQSRANIRPQPYQPPVEEPVAPPSPPSWMQRARQEAQPQPQPFRQVDEQPDYQPSPVHPLQRYAAQHSEPPPAAYATDHAEADQDHHEPSRYDDALYGQLDDQAYQRDAAYPDDPYAYQNDYQEEEPVPRKRTFGLIQVAGILMLAVVGTGGALAYRTYVTAPRSGEPPIIKADNSPTKIVPAPADGVTKTPDRLASGDTGEKIVSREEAPVDVNVRSPGPRVVFPAPNMNANPPPAVAVAPSPPPAAAANGTMPNSEPRKIRTLSVKGDAAEAGVPASAPPPSKPAATARVTNPAPVAAPRTNPASANASANAPMSIVPGAAQQPDPGPSRVASINPAQPAAPATSSGSYLVQVSAQKTDAEARSSYRALQGKFPAALGAHSPVVTRVDKGDKGGVVYRASAGPFGTREQATQFCENLKSAGGQCFVQRN